MRAPVVVMTACAAVQRPDILSENTRAVDTRILVDSGGGRTEGAFLARTETGRADMWRELQLSGDLPRVDSPRTSSSAQRGSAGRVDCCLLRDPMECDRCAR
ncbi:MAG: hypothetical protein ACKV2T_21390 [Kofleriaceae bacterium]